MNTRTTQVVLGVFILAVSLWLSGCAGVSIQKDGDGPGYDVYRPEPYLMVSMGEKGLVGKIIWLPNYTEKYRVRPYNYLADADSTITITDGWKLTSIAEKSNNTELASSMVEVLKETLIAKFNEERQEKPVEVKLYRLLFDDKKGYVNGAVEVKLPFNE